jgi:hypothetical protein
LVLKPDSTAAEHNINRPAGFQYSFCFSLCDNYVDDATSEIKPERVRLPLLRDEGIKVKLAVPDPHSPKTLYKTHPRTCHARDVAAILRVVIIIVEIEPRGTQVELIRLVGVPQSGCQDHMHTRGQGRFMNGHWLVEIKISPDGIFIKFVLEKIQALQHIRLLDKT